MINLGVLVSGNGTNLQSIIDAVESKRLNARIGIVISNNPSAYAVKRAKRHKIPVEIIPNNIASDKEDYDTIVIDKLKR